MKLSIGFSTESKRWSIKLAKVRHSLFDDGWSSPGRYVRPIEGVDLQELIKSAEGRQEIARMLSDGEPLFD